MALDTMIEQMLTKQQQQEELQKRHAAERKAQAEHQAEEKFGVILTELFSTDFLAEVNFSFVHRYGSNTLDSRVTSACFHYQEFTWYLTHFRSAWRISCQYIELPQAYWETRAESILPADLQVRLLLEIGKKLKEVREAEAAQKEQVRCRQEHEARIKAQEMIAEEARRHDLEKAQAEHMRLRALLDEARIKAQAELWRWPEGRTIEIYKVEYCQGAYREEGDSSFDYNTDNWTVASLLDHQQRIRIEPVNRSYGPVSAQVVQLMPEVHFPRWFVYHFSSMEELPPELRQEVRISVPHVVERRTRADGELRLVEAEELAYDEYGWYSEKVGVEPLPWVRVLVENL